MPRLLEHDLSHHACVFHAGAGERGGPNRAIQLLAWQSVIAAEVGFPGDAFRGGFDAESLEGNHNVSMPALCLCIDVGFAGPVAVPGGVVFAVAGVHDVGDAAVEGVVSAGGVGTLGEAVEEWLGGIRSQIHIDGFLIGEDAVAVEGGELGFIAERGFGAEVEGVFVVEEADGRRARQRVQRREEREFVRGGGLPLGAVEREFGGRFGDGEFLEAGRRSMAHGLRVPVEAGVRIRLLIAVVGELQVLRVVTGKGEEDVVPFLLMPFGVKRGDEGVSRIDSIEQAMQRRLIGCHLPGLMQVYDLREVLQVIKLGANECEACLDLRCAGELLGLREVALHRGKHARRVEEGDELKRVLHRFASASIGGQRFVGPHVRARADVIGVERDGVIQLVVKGTHVEGDALVRERALAELGDEVLRVVVRRIIKHAAHGVIHRPFEAKELAGAVAIQRLDARGGEPLHLQLDVARRAHRRVARAEVRAPVIDVAGEAARHLDAAPRGDVLLVRAGEHDAGVRGKLVKRLRRLRSEDVAHHRDLPAGMRFLHALRHLAIEDPDLLRPVLARAVERVALLALALAEAIRLAEIHAVKAALQVRNEVAVDALLHLGIRQAILPVALRLQTRAADQREVFRMLRKQLRRHRPLPRVPAELLIHPREAIVREIIKRTARRMRRVHAQQWRLRHVQRVRHRDRLHRQELDGGRRHEVDLRRATHRRVARQIRIQETHTEKLPRKVHRRLRRAHAIPVRPPRILHLRLRGLIIPREDHIPPHHPLHIAPIPQLRDFHSILPRQNRVPEHQRRFGAIPLLFPHNGDLRLVRQKRRLEQSRRLLKTRIDGRSRCRIRQHDLVVRFTRVEQREVCGGCGGYREEEREEEFHVGT